jgi:hypothetical protein
MDTIDRPCWFTPCPDPVAFDAIGTYDNVFGIEETIAMALCWQHAEVVGDDLVLLDAS